MSDSIHNNLAGRWSNSGKPIRRSSKIERTSRYRTDIESIADAYDAAPEMDPQAAQYWQALAADSAQRANALRQQYNISETDDPEPYANAQEMFTDLDKGDFAVSRANSDHPIWTPDQNVDFRIVHDVMGHYPTGGDFSWNGENDACNAHAMKLADPLARKALMTECLGQTGSAIRNGGFGPQKMSLLDGYGEPWDQEWAARKASEDQDRPYCHRNIRNGLWPSEEEGIPSIHSGIVDDFKRNVKKVSPKERKRLKENPELDDYPNHRQWKVNVGETNAQQLVKWLHQYNPGMIAPTVDMEGMWKDEREPSGQAQVINATRGELEDMLTAYGFDHPQEEAIGILPEGVGDRNTVLWSNPYNKVKVEKDAPPRPNREVELPPGINLEPPME